MKKKLFFVLVLALALASCSPVSAGVSSDAGSETSQEVEPVSVDLSQITPEQGENVEGGEAVEAPAPRTRNSEAKLTHDVSLDLSKRLELDISAVTQVDIEEVTWPSSALGCPADDVADDVAYTEAEIEGFQITLEAQGKDYIYHTNGFETFIWCDAGTPVEPVDG
ncbi:MAG: hypothetical protein U9O54_01380 [Chloroflexota bacterium]|nr:hypothetical protein [Chloroflexota bacterium]